MTSTIKKDAKGRYRYQFQHQGKTYSKAWFSTRAAAVSSREEHKKRVKAEGRVGEGLTFLDLANQYLDFSKRRHAPRTYAYKVIVFRRFKEFAGDLPVDKIDGLILESFFRTRSGSVSYNRHKRELCSMLRWCYRRELIAKNVCDFLENLPEPRYVPPVPSQEELAKIMLAAGKDRPLLLTCYHTMGRIGEILGLRWDDINFSERTIKLWTSKTKTGAPRFDLLPINQALYKTLWRLWEGRSQDEWVFLNPKTKTRYDRRPKLMHSICKRAGVPHYGFHAIRHFAASRLYDTHKFSMAKVSRLLRHSSKRTTEIYLQSFDADLRQVLESLSGDFSEKG